MADETAPHADQGPQAGYTETRISVTPSGASSSRIHVTEQHVDSASGPGYTIQHVEVDPLYATELKLTYATDPLDVVAWLEHHGHRAWYAGYAPHSEAQTVVMFDHGPGTEARAAMPGDTLTVRDTGVIVIS